MRGKFWQSEKYCSKQNTLYKFGTEPIGQGGRTDRNQVYAWLKEGKSELEIMDLDFASYQRFRNAIADYRELTPPVRVKDRVCEVYLFYGRPGTGKTEFALDQIALLGRPHCRLPLGKDFWFTRTAQGAHVLLIDDFKSNIALVDLLQIIDKHGCEVPRKGGFVWVRFDFVFFTTNRSPYVWYDYSTRDFERDALFRRFDHGGAFIFEKNSDGVPQPCRVDIYDEFAFIERRIPREIFHCDGQ